MDRPLSEVELTPCLVQKVAAGPFPPAPAQTVQLAHPGMASIVENVVTEPEGEAEGAPPFTFMPKAFVRTFPGLSQACTTTECPPRPTVTSSSNLAESTEKADRPSM